MDEHDAELIARAVAGELERQRTIDVETHRKHHEFIDTLILDRDRRNDRIENLIKGVSVWIVILILTMVGLSIWNLVKFNLLVGG